MLVDSFSEHSVLINYASNNHACGLFPPINAQPGFSDPQCRKSTSGGHIKLASPVKVQPHSKQMSSVEEITAAINAKGEEIRVVKAAKAPTMKDDLAPLVSELLALKIQYSNITGEEFGGSKPEKKEKAPVQQEKKSDGPSKSELNKLKRKENKAAKKAEERGEEGGETVAASNNPTNGAATGDDAFAHLYGDAPMIQSAYMSEKVYLQIHQVTEDMAGQKIWLRARVSTSRAVGKGVFFLLRQTVNTVQGVMFQGPEIPKQMVKYGCAVSLESIVDVQAVVTVPETPIQGATVKNLELSIVEIHVISRAQELPFNVEDAGRSAESAAETGLPVVNQDTALNFRWVDTRTPANQAIFRIQSGVCQLFRQFLLDRDFVEIHTPKLIGGASEGGSNVFKLQYFNQPACLAQSPQLYKQMTAACGGFERVFEIGPVFRAEDSNTHS
jgi:lysyl-tRNA synthetase class II